MTTEMSLWALLFIMYGGVIWITILHKLQRIERLLKFGSTDKQNGRPNNNSSYIKPKDTNG
jgi:hypothetical protein